MAFFPLTYLQILIFLCMCFTYPSLSLKFTGSFIGWWTGLNLFTGELWLSQNPTTGVLSMITLTNIYDFQLALIITVVSIIQTLVGLLRLFDLRKQGLTFKEILTA